MNTAEQTVETFQLNVLPAAKLQYYRDFYANVVHHFEIPEPHANLTIESVVQARTRPPQALDSAATVFPLQRIGEDNANRVAVRLVLRDQPSLISRLDAHGAQIGTGNHPLERDQPAFETDEIELVVAWPIEARPPVLIDPLAVVEELKEA